MNKLKKNIKTSKKPRKKPVIKLWPLIGILAACFAALIFSLIKLIVETDNKKTTPAVLPPLVIAEEEVLAEPEPKVSEVLPDVSSDNDIITEYNTDTEGSLEEEEPEWECYLSEDFLSVGSDWNLINTVENTDGVTDYIPINPKYYYTAYSLSEMTITSYDSEKIEIASVTENMSSGEYFVFTEDARYVKIGFSGNGDYFVSSGICVDTNEQPESGLAFYVISPNAPVAMSVSRAVSYLQHWGTVLILPGDYQENICSYNKVINLYGVSRDRCRIISYDGDYENPPLEIAAGNIRNLSFMALGTDDVHERKAYAVHADYNYQNTKSLTFYNCYMYSDYNSGLGMGTRSGNVTINSCTIDGNNTQNGDFFLHDTVDPAFVGDCNITIKNSSFERLVFNAMEIDGNNVVLTLKNNTVSEIAGYNAATNGYFDGFYLGLKNFTLSADSDVG